MASFCIRFLLVFVLGSAAWQAANATRVALIGDFGVDSSAEGTVATMINSWYSGSFPFQALVTVGDNCYSTGTLSEMDPKVGKYYSKYFYPFNGCSASTCGAASGCPLPCCATNSCGSPDAVNRFFPTPGNHDWGTPNLAGYLAYMPVNNQRYYTTTVGDIGLFMVDSDTNEPSGTSSTSTQAIWLRDALAASTANWKLVLFHHPPYSSSSTHGSSLYMRWSFQAWGAHAVFSGHDHGYERVLISGFPYFVEGRGGAGLYAFSSTPVTGSTVRYNAYNGAMQLESTATTLQMRAYAVSSGYPQVDCYQATKGAGGAVTYGTCGPAAPPSPPPPPGTATRSFISRADVTAPGSSNQATWAYSIILNTASPPAGWTAASFDDSAWSSGPSPLGYGVDLDWSTTVPSTTSGTGGGSYLYRLKFCLSSAERTWASPLSLALFAAADNSVDVYLNGVAVLTEGSATDHEITYWNNDGVVVAGSNLVAGTNIIAARVYNTAGSSDSGFDLDLRYTSANTAMTVCGASASPPSPPPRSPPPPSPPPPPPATVSATRSLITAATVTAPTTSNHASWKYFTITGSTSPPTNWNAIVFTDTAWSAGQSPLGYSTDLPWYTTLSSSTSGTGGGSYLFRFKFCLSSTELTWASALSLSLFVASDDQVQVFINGNQVLSESSTTNHEIAYWNNNGVAVAGSLLVAGTNVIAARVYNTAGSSDAGFDLDLRYTSVNTAASICAAGADTGDSIGGEEPASQDGGEAHKAAALPASAAAGIAVGVIGAVVLLAGLAGVMLMKKRPSVVSPWPAEGPAAVELGRPARAVPSPIA